MIHMKIGTTIRTLEDAIEHYTELQRLWMEQNAEVHRMKAEVEHLKTVIRNIGLRYGLSGFIFGMAVCNFIYQL